MKRILLGILILGFVISLANAQNIAITDDDGYSADPSAMLDVKSTVKGILVPRLTTDQRIAVVSPATGLLVFDIGFNSFFFFNGNIWVDLSSSSDLWSSDGLGVYVADPDQNMGVGTLSANGKLEVKGDGSGGADELLFAVRNTNGDTIFAVYDGAVRIYVEDNSNKPVGSRGGFAVGGISGAKGFTNEFLRVTPDSVRIYVDGAQGKPVGSRGGFAVGGISGAKGASSFLQLTEENYFIGHQAGFNNVGGKSNVFIGYQAGYSNVDGSGNIFLGDKAGYDIEGNNLLIVANPQATTPLLYGDFLNKTLVINGTPNNNPDEATLFVNGSLGALESLLAPSDRRLKKNIQTIPSALNKVMQLRGVNYEWKDAEKSKGVKMGFIAQEAKDVIPEVVQGSKDDTYSMQYAPITAVLVEAIKEQQKLIEDLQKRIEHLESK